MLTVTLSCRLLLILVGLAFLANVGSSEEGRIIFGGVGAIIAFAVLIVGATGAFG